MPYIHQKFVRETRFLASIVLLFACSVLQSGCNRAPVYNDPIPEHEELKIESAAIGETRNINVYLPPNYASADSSYPVLYMPDGGIKEDFPHIANTLTAMIEAGEIAPLILVGIENTNRKRDLTGKSDLEKDKALVPDHGGSENFRNFIRNELRSTIEKQFRCNGETAIVGESLAGLFVVETLVVDPDLFDRYIAFDPSLWWNDSQLEVAAEFPGASKLRNGKQLWLASSSAEGMGKRSSRLAKVLNLDSENPMVLDYQHCPGEEHSTIFRAKKREAFGAVLWQN